MKNLFNNISREEKNRILEMHSGKKRVIFEDEMIGDMNETSMNVIPKDFVLFHLEMSKLYPYLVKKGTPINVKNGIVSFNALFSAFNCVVAIFAASLLASCRLKSCFMFSN